MGSEMCPDIFLAGKLQISTILEMRRQPKAKQREATKRRYNTKNQELLLVYPLNTIKTTTEITTEQWYIILQVKRLHIH